MSSPCVRAAARLTLAACALGLLLGCRGEEKLYPVKGRITINGQPLKGAVGAIAFVADEEKGNQTKHEPRGEINADGEFELKTIGKAGAPAGWYKVLVMAQTEQVKVGNPYAVPKWAVPVEYTKAETTTVRVEVIAEPGADHYHFDVKKK